MEYESSSVEREEKKSRRIVASVFYILIVVASLVTLGGAVWSLADWLIGPTGKFETFLGLNLGYQIAIIGGLLAGIFFVLVFFFGLFKKSSKSLIKFIYKKRELEEKYKNRTDVKIAAGGLLISLIGIIIGVIVAVVLDLLGGSSGTFSLLDFLSSTGPWVLFIGIGLFVIAGVALFMIYFWKNGYYLILRIMGILEKDK
ncbi:MAG: hypothetical protein ACXADU_03060 [Promethearchaeota archaeon]|jgi:membrane protease YdiL (CAAX protease family)